MEIIISIPDKDYKTNQKQIEKSVEELHYSLSDIECEIKYKS